MAATSASITSLIKKDLSQELLTHPEAALTPYLLHIAERLSIILKGDHRVRDESVAKFNLFRQEYSAKLSTLISESTQKSAAIIKRMQIDKSDQTLGIKLQNITRNLAGEIAFFLAVLKTCHSNALHYAGACQEYSMLSAACLLSQFGIGSERLLTIESIAISVTDQPELNHQLLVINRNPDSLIEDISSWGDDCLLFDPQNRWISTIHNIPKTSSLDGHKSMGPYSPYTISKQLPGFSGFDDLSSYKNNRVYGQLVKDVESAVVSFVQQEINTMLESVGLGASSAFLTEKTSAISIVHYLEHISDLKFTPLMDRDYFLHCLASLSTKEDELKANKLIDTVHYGRIITSPKQNKYLFFADVNCSEKSSTFRESVRTMEMTGLTGVPG
jgi:hypothetical protein